jgi:hypothetical protein
VSTSVTPDHRAALSRIRAPSRGKLANPTARTPKAAKAIRDVMVHAMNSTPLKSQAANTKRLAKERRTKGKIAARSVYK